MSRLARLLHRFEHLARPLHYLVVLLVLGFLFLFVRGLDLHALGAALRSASPLLVGAAALLNLVHLALRTLRLRDLLAPARRIGPVRLYRYSLALCAGNNLLPARAGEAVRVWLLHSRERIAAGTSVSVSAMEKLCDLVALLLLASPVPFVVEGLPSWVLHALVASLCLAFGLIVAVAIFLRVHRDVARDSLLHRIALGAHTLRSPRTLLPVALYSLFIWLSDGGALLLCARAVGAHIPIAGTVFVMVAVNLAIAVPSTPAQVGAFELGTVAALRVLGLAEEQALAIALLYHLVQVVPVTVLGLPDLLSITRARAAARAGSSPEAPTAPP